MPGYLYPSEVSRYYTGHMSTELTWQTESTSLEDTLRLAGQIGANLRGGEVFELASDLGGGKTAFVRGLASGMGSGDTVRSPSFTIAQEYRTEKLRLHHYDFYRLHEAGIISEELEENIHEPDAVVVVEWADIVENALPADRMRITIRATGDTSREFEFTYPDTLAYLLKDVQ
jgi:tRNA threonylcarbamoyladenosine biosynthesis protein TsaE